MTMDRNTLGQIQSRRRFLEQTACGLGGMALWQLMADDTGLKAHFAPRAKNVIFLFMPGAPLDQTVNGVPPLTHAINMRKVKCIRLLVEQATSVFVITAASLAASTTALAWWLATVRPPRTRD